MRAISDLGPRMLELSETLLSRPALAQRLGVSISSLKRYEASGALKSRKIGPRLIRYTIADIVAFEQRGAKPDK